MVAENAEPWHKLPGMGHSEGGAATTPPVAAASCYHGGEMGTHRPLRAATLVDAVRDAVRSIGAIAGDGLAAALRPTPRTVPIYRDTRYSFAERAADLVSR